tara:strand:- start:972 stop:1301 length:330 start_codon:yes stop_codon:yes gene_type:complete
MINLHQKFNHYLNTDKKLDTQDVNEKIISYGWTDDGKDIVGYYVLTENYELLYNLKDEFVCKHLRKGGRVVYGTGLENQRGCKSSVGSNPTPSVFSELEKTAPDYGVGK